MERRWRDHDCKNWAMKNQPGRRRGTGCGFGCLPSGGSISRSSILNWPVSGLPLWTQREAADDRAASRATYSAALPMMPRSASIGRLGLETSLPLLLWDGGSFGDVGFWRAASAHSLPDPKRTCVKELSFQPAFLRRMAMLFLSLTCLSRLIAKRFSQARLSVSVLSRTRLSSSRRGSAPSQRLGGGLRPSPLPRS